MSAAPFATSPAAKVHVLEHGSFLARLRRLARGVTRIIGREINA